MNVLVARARGLPVGVPLPFAARWRVVRLRKPLFTLFLYRAPTLFQGAPKQYVVADRDESCICEGGARAQNLAQGSVKTRMALTVFFCADTGSTLI